MRVCARVQVPPLRVRPADILDLERYYMRVISKEQGVKLTLTQEAERALLAYSFPENITVRGFFKRTDARIKQQPAARTDDRIRDTLTWSDCWLAWQHVGVISVTRHCRAAVILFGVWCVV